MNNRIIQVNDSGITIIDQKGRDYISFTDMTTTFKEGSGLIGKWITNKNTLEYLGIWEKINNPNFNYPEFGVIGQEAGTNRFIMSAGQWIGRTNAIGIIVKAGRYGGTYAHKDIAFNFAMWLSPEFQIYLVNEFQRLKDDENKEWRSKNSEKKGNIRDYATIEQLVVLSNMESINALLIREGLSQSERLILIN
ncbi:KilA-N domain-containing protein [Capnocytophaga granulosa]